MSQDDLSITRPPAAQLSNFETVSTGYSQLGKRKLFVINLDLFSNHFCPRTSPSPRTPHTGTLLQPKSCLASSSMHSWPASPARGATARNAWALASACITARGASARRFKNCGSEQEHLALIEEENMHAAVTLVQVQGHSRNTRT